MMNKTDKKILWLTAIICILPTVYGLINYGKLPDEVAIHFDMNNDPNSFVPKWFVILMPAIMTLLQVFVCITSDMKMENKEANRKATRVFKWIIPVICWVVYIMTINNALGIQTDIRKGACLIIGIVFIIAGNYIPKTKPNSMMGVRTMGTMTNETLWKTANRLMGYGFILAGILMLVSTFFKPIVSVMVLLFIIAEITALHIYAYTKK